MRWTLYATATTGKRKAAPAGMDWRDYRYVGAIEAPDRRAAIGVARGAFGRGLRFSGERATHFLTESDRDPLRIRKEGDR